jgi:hypothetical protein
MFFRRCVYNMRISARSVIRPTPHPADAASGRRRIQPTPHPADAASGRRRIRPTPHVAPPVSAEGLR